jgi:uncharacterized membrane protein
VAGNIGKGTNGQLSAIFGTDAAGPLFNQGSPDRLDFNDAVYTEVKPYKNNFSNFLKKFSFHSLLSQTLAFSATLNQSLMPLSILISAIINLDVDQMIQIAITPEPINCMLNL